MAKVERARKAIKISTKDGVIHTIDLRIAVMSRTLKDMLDAHGMLGDPDKADGRPEAGDQGGAPLVAPLAEPEDAGEDQQQEVKDNGAESERLDTAKGGSQEGSKQTPQQQRDQDDHEKEKEKTLFDKKQQDASEGEKGGAAASGTVEEDPDCIPTGQKNGKQPGKEEKKGEGKIDPEPQGKTGTDTRNGKDEADGKTDPAARGGEKKEKNVEDEGKDSPGNVKMDSSEPTESDKGEEAQGGAAAGKKDGPKEGKEGGKEEKDLSYPVETIIGGLKIYEYEPKGGKESGKDEADSTDTKKDGPKESGKDDAGNGEAKKVGDSSEGKESTGEGGSQARASITSISSTATTASEGADIPQVQLDCHVFGLYVRWAERHVDYNPQVLANKKLVKLCPWDEAFFNFLHINDRHGLFELWRASDYLNIELLQDALGKFIASQIGNKQPEQIKEFFTATGPPITSKLPAGTHPARQATVPPGQQNPEEPAGAVGGQKP